MVNEKLRKQLNDVKDKLETQLSSPTIESLKEFNSQPEAIKKGWLCRVNPEDERLFKVSTRQFFTESGIICSNFALDEMWLSYRESAKKLNEHFGGFE